MEQVVSERSTSTYDNVLTISGASLSVVGNYTCIVANALGTDSMEEAVTRKCLVFMGFASLPWHFFVHSIYC